MTFYFNHKRADFWFPNLVFFHFSASLRTTVPLVSYIRISLRFWYYTSLSTCCGNLKKNWSHRKNLGERGGQTFKGSDREKLSILVLWQLPTSSLRFLFGEEDQLKKINLIGEKKISWSAKKNSGKWHLFEETISLPEPKFYWRIYGDCYPS